MKELRLHLQSEQEFEARVERQRAEGYTLAYLTDGATVESVAGFRLLDYLAYGRFLYVDDLVTRSDSRGKGYGARLFAWLVQHARENGCTQLHLDSGVQRFGAHRFYLQAGMDITCHHFAMVLDASGGPTPS